MATEERDTFGARVADARRLNGWTLDDLASRTQGALTRSVIANIETDRTKPSLEQALALSVALEVPLFALIFDLHHPHRVSERSPRATTSESVNDGAAMTNYELGAWMSNPDDFYSPDALPSRRRASELMDAIEAMRSADRGLRRTLVRIINAVNARELNSHEWDQHEADRLAGDYRLLEDQMRQVEFLRRRVDDLGIDWSPRLQRTIDRVQQHEERVSPAMASLASRMVPMSAQQRAWNKAQDAIDDYGDEGDDGERQEAP